MPDFAPEYSKKERVIIILKIFLWAIPLFVFLKLIALPWFDSFAKTAHCFSLGNITGIQIVFYSVFVVLPVSLALMVALIIGPREFRVWKLGQDPLPGEKVFRPTRYVFGWKAKIKPLIFLGITLFFVGLGVRGVFWANDLIEKTPAKTQFDCTETNE